MLTVDGRVRGMASDEVGGGEESNDDQMRLSSRNQFPSLTLLSLLCACDLTPSRKMAVISQSIIFAFQDKKKGRSKSPSVLSKKEALLRNPSSPVIGQS